MFDNRDTGRVEVPYVLDFDALDPVLGIVECVQVRHGCGRHALQAGSYARLIHEVEHDLEALTLGPEDQSATLSIVTEAEGAGGRGVNPHLLLDPRAGHVVRLAQAAVPFHP